MFPNVPAGSADMRTFPNLKNFAAFITKTRTSTTWGLIPGAADSSDSCWNFQALRKLHNTKLPMALHLLIFFVCTAAMQRWKAVILIISSHRQLANLQIFDCEISALFFLFLLLLKFGICAACRTSHSLVVSKNF